MPLLISLKVALSATCITFCLGVPVAYFMAHYRGRGRSLLDSLFLLPLVLPPTVIGFLLLWLFGNQGPLHSLFRSAFPNLVFTVWAAVITAVVVSFPLMYRTGRAAFGQIDSQLPKVARTLGASEGKVFWQVAVPLAMPGLIAGTLLAFARSLGEFGATLMLAGNIPGKTQTLPMAVYFAVEGGDFRAATRWSLVIIAISGLSVAVANYASSYRSKSAARSSQISVESEQKTAVSSSSAQTDPVLLDVDITKRLGSFTLKVKFQTTEALLSVLGESGAGKSLLLRCLAGIETPDSGRIVLGERILYDARQKIDVPSCDRKIALLFQNYALFPHLTVAQNVAFGIAKPKTTQLAIATEELSAVGMSEFTNAYPQQLSGGQQQRVALARALATRPDLLLLDEPFSALDTHLRSRLSQQLFSRLSTYPGKTLLVTHNLTEAYRAHQLVVLHGGQVLQQDSPAKIFNHPKTAATAQLTGPCNLSPAQYSPAQCKSASSVYAQRWQMALSIPAAAIPHNASKSFSVGIRPQNVSFITLSKYASHQTPPKAPARIAFPNAQNLPPSAKLAANQAYCWPVDDWRSPNSVVVLVKLHSPANRPDDYHLQAMVSHQIWQQQQQQPLPWIVHLPPHHLIVLRP